MLLTWVGTSADTALLPTRWWERAMPPPHHTRVRGRLMQKPPRGSASLKTRRRPAVDAQLLPGAGEGGRGGEGIVPD